MLETLSEELKTTRAFEVEMRKFGDLVSNNKTLQELLSNAVDDGISKEGFCSLYVSTAEENGISFTIEQMNIAIQEQKQGKDKVLPSFVQKLITIL